MNNRYWSIIRAQEYARSKGIARSLPTIRKYVKDYELGYQLGGRTWVVDIKKFCLYIRGKSKNNGHTDEKQAYGE